MKKRDKIRSQNEAMEKSISGLTIKEQKSVYINNNIDKNKIHFGNKTTISVAN